MSVTFEDFVTATGSRLRAALVGAYGPEVGLDAAADALAYGWEHWERLRVMDNPAGYLFRVGQTSARRGRSRSLVLAAPPPDTAVNFEPRLIPALVSLSEAQRVCVVMVHGYGWSISEVAEVLEVSASSVRTHLCRGIAHLQATLEVTHDAK